ncbi:MAG: transglutaminase-like domain-containing protein [Bacteroidota bacterium]
MGYESEIRALLILLDDPDESIYLSVKNRLEEESVDALPFFSEFYNEAVNKLRYDEIEAKIIFKEIFNYLNYIKENHIEFPIEEFCFKISKVTFPFEDSSKHLDQLNQIAIKLKERLSLLDDPIEIIKKVNEYIFDELKMEGNIDNYFEVENNYITKLLERKKANPITLSLLYIFICQRLNIPVKGIGLPGHFIVSYQFNENQIFIDTFNRGKFLTKDECREYVIKSGYTFTENLLLPQSNIKIAERILNNLTYYFEKIENKFKSQMCIKCIEIINQFD